MTKQTNHDNERVYLGCSDRNTQPRCAKSRLVLEHEGRLNDLDEDYLSMAAEIEEQREVNMAFDAIQIHLPQQGNHRVTFNGATDGHNGGLGFGYAYMFEGTGRHAMTFGLGASGSEEVLEIGYSFEF